MFYDIVVRALIKLILLCFKRALLITVIKSQHYWILDSDWPESVDSFSTLEAQAVVILLYNGQSHDCSYKLNMQKLQIC